ncbi:hypothetical protein COCMIDRAFT_83243 [Bipolaris oryzae ATCC 44560]|uniref:Uncharacterized protein n=1 Tax=Bipolaris oryzae ATCC 44560 TaxID=930090 RepID=W6ZDL4_COCMI|nr:uncharacterized protein COCMIDRAFT_83243 [Bipolaris oryzae ATCC 44560]EUC49912.1 hypothetical protein COCMIDRAFT_83243 [Bipolaris oryzae ATCC 44560]
MRREVAEYIAQRTRLRILRGAMRGLRRRQAADPRGREEDLEALDEQIRELALLLNYGE